MYKSKVLRFFFILTVIALNTACDQLSKVIIRQKLAQDQSISLADGHLLVARVENTGAFLSLGDNMQGPLRVLVLSAIPVALLIMSIAYLLSNKNIHILTMLGICFIVGGGIGNIYDRVAYGSVTDFLYVRFHPFHTGVFNLADVSITTGAILILIGMNVKNPPRFFRRRPNTADAVV